MLDGIIITERGSKTEKVLYSRKTPTLMASLSSTFKQKHKQDNQAPPSASANLTSPSALKQRRMSTAMQFHQRTNSTPPTPQTLSTYLNTSNSNSQSSIPYHTTQYHQNDYIHSNVSWAEGLLQYVKKVQKGCLPTVDGSFLVTSFMNNRLIVFTMVGSICFYVIGDEDHGEMMLREIGKSVVELCKSACKRNPDDAETLVKHYAKVISAIDQVLFDERYVDSDSTVRSIHELVD